MNLTNVNKAAENQDRNPQLKDAGAGKKEDGTVQTADRPRNYDSYDKGVGVYENRQVAEKEASDYRAADKKSTEAERGNNRAAEAQPDYARDYARAVNRLAAEEKPDFKAISLIKNSLPSPDDAAEDESRYSDGAVDSSVLFDSSDFAKYESPASKAEESLVSASESNRSKLNAAQQRGLEVYQRMQSYQNPINLSLARMAM
ncbi:MAG: hypothetical protein LBI38_01750 [Oscillospiraceae bacterium]|jgi:hypothetical protein|nr:hypothetical protein [Oscillospiraceae bacterium]